MAPFKLKFRMGNSRSTSQEHDPDPQVNEALLNHHAATMGASSSTIDSADGNSLGSLNTNERKSLLPNKNNNLRMGFITQSNFATHEADESEECNAVPVTPPPSYEHVLEEKTYENAHQQQQCAIEEPVVTQQQQLQRGNSNQSIGLELLSITCKEPDCDYQEHHLQRQLTNSSTNSNNNITHNNNNHNSNNNNNNSTYNEQISEQSDTEDKFINMSGPSTSAAAGRVQYMSEYNGDCQECENEANSQHCQNEQNIYYQREGSYSQIYEEPRNYNEQHMDGNDTGNENEWHLNQHHHQQQQQQQQHHQQQQQQQQQQEQQRRQQQAQQEYERSMTPEIISNKSSKEIYKDLAKQWGITCKMSDGCRCMECQSHYFDCEFDDNDHQKTDGGLGAGTPMFISEVMHGTACNIL